MYCAPHAKARVVVLMGSRGFGCAGFFIAYSYNARNAPYMSKDLHWLASCARLAVPAAFSGG